MNKIRVKICGITRLEDAKIAASHGVDALGFIFYKKSKRYIEPEKVKSIIENLPPFISFVGVFVNEDIDLVKKIARECKLDYVQLHGEEDSKYIDTVKKDVKVIKAFRVKDDNIITELKELKSDYFLLDAYNKDNYGGTGEKFNWNIVKQANNIGDVILAGGIKIEDICKIKTEIKPYGIDLSSGVEISPGIKSKEKIIEILNKINMGE